MGATLLYADKPVDPLTIAIVDLDNTLESRFAYSALVSSGKRSSLIDIRRVSARRAETLLRDGTACAVFTIPEGFTSSVTGGENSPITAVFNPEMPMRTALVGLLSDSALELLETAQTGIYTVLEYVQDHDPDNFQISMEHINLRYITWVLAHASLFDKVEVTATGRISLPLHYLICALVFLMTLSAAVFFSVIRNGFPGDTLWRLRSFGVGGFQVIAGWILSLTIWSLFCGLVLSGCYTLFSSRLLLPNHHFALAVLPLLCLQFSAFTCMISFLFPEDMSGGIFVTSVSIGGLVLSGGILPHSFLPPEFEMAARFVPSYWSGALLMDGLYGVVNRTALVAVAISTVLMTIVGAICVSLRGRAVKRI